MHEEDGEGFTASLASLAALKRLDLYWCILARGETPSAVQKRHACIQNVTDQDCKKVDVEENWGKISTRMQEKDGRVDQTPIQKKKRKGRIRLGVLLLHSDW